MKLVIPLISRFLERLPITDSAITDFTQGRIIPTQIRFTADAANADEAEVVSAEDGAPDEVRRTVTVADAEERNPEKALKYTLIELSTGDIIFRQIITNTAKVIYSVNFTDAEFFGEKFTVTADRKITDIIVSIFFGIVFKVCIS